MLSACARVFFGIHRSNFVSLPLVAFGWLASLDDDGDGDGGGDVHDLGAYTCRSPLR